MRSPVATIRPEAAVREAVDLMRARKIRHLPVVDGSGRLVGIITDRDLRQIVFAPAVQERLRLGIEAVWDIAVREVMTWAVITIGPTADVREAAHLMHEQKIGALPVTEGGRLVGILTESDVLSAFEELSRAQLTTVRPVDDMAPGGTYDYGYPEPGRGQPWPEEAGTPADPGDHVTRPAIRKG